MWPAPAVAHFRGNCQSPPRHSGLVWARVCIKQGRVVSLSRLVLTLPPPCRNRRGYFGAANATLDIALVLFVHNLLAKGHQRFLESAIHLFHLVWTLESTPATSSTSIDMTERPGVWLWWGKRWYLPYVCPRKNRFSLQSTT